MRTFIALELPEEFADDTAALARQLKRSVEGRFMEPETYHITLAFIGEIGEAQARDVIDALDAACRDCRPIPLRADGLGKFGKPADATLWLELAAEPALTQLASRVREELSARGISFDPKPFRAHITLARRARLPRGPLPALPFPAEARATTVTFFKSTLSHEGASYKPLYEVDLPA